MNWPASIISLSGGFRTLNPAGAMAYCSFSFSQAASNSRSRMPGSPARADSRSAPCKMPSSGEIESALLSSQGNGSVWDGFSHAPWHSKPSSTLRPPHPTSKKRLPRPPTPLRRQRLPRPTSKLGSQRPASPPTPPHPRRPTTTTPCVAGDSVCPRPTHSLSLAAALDPPPQHQQQHFRKLD